MEKRIVIVGGTGFIGEYIARVLAPGAHVVVLGKDDTIQALRENLIPGAVLVILSPPVVGLMEKILSIAESNAPERVLYASSTLAYQSGGQAHRETDPLEGTTDYARGKILEESLLGAFSDRTGVPVVIARLGSVYGDSKNRGVIGNLMNALFDGRSVPLSGGGMSVRDFIHVSDVARAFRLLATCSLPGGVEIFNVSSGVGTRIADLPGIIESATGKRPATHAVPAADDTQYVIGDPLKMRGIGWKPEYDLAKGVAETYRRYLAKRGN